MPLSITPTESGARQAAVSKLKSGYVSVALQIQEAATDLSHQDLAKRLHSAVQDAHRGSGNYGAYIDHFGDDESGDVVYSCNGDTMSCPYSVESVGGYRSALVGTFVYKGASLGVDPTRCRGAY